MFSKGYINSNPVKFSYFKIIVAIALIVGLCAYISPRAILVAIEGMDLGFLSVAIALMPVFILCRTLKWYFLVRQINSDIRFVDILPSYLRGMLAGLFTPLRLGEAIRTIGTGQTSTQCALFVVEKMIELLSLLVLCSIVLIKLQPEMAWVMIPACLIILFSRRILIYIAIRSVRLLSRLFHKPSSVDLPQVEDDIRQLRLSGCAILSVCVFLIFMGQAYLLMLSMEYHTPLSVLFDFPIVMIGNLLPVTIGGFGIRETIAVVVLQPRGVSAAVAMSSFAIVAMLDLVVPAFLGTFLTLFKAERKTCTAFAAPMSDSEGWEEFWEKRNVSLSGRFLSWVRRRFVTPKLVTFVLKNTECGTLVEAGCGTGEVSLQSARHRGDRVILVDKSQRALAMAQEKANEIGVNAEVVQCDITSLSSHVGPVRDAATFNIGVIEHFPDCSRVLNEMSNIGGRNAFAVIPERSLFWRFFVVVSRRLKLVPDDFFIRLYSQNDLHAVVQKAGLRVLRMSRVRIFGIIPYLGVCFKNVATEETGYEFTS